ncbi:bifunctional metallophosphatase/5'-nucleotidase [Paenibacillus sp. NPDC058071]|uniref:bifunctional metallophosphatase/5'-nucleotidase n=1 Tax=Paenibacillus sp. NPDC058071 TaxID=3346326 RepID=UPI0036DED325
MGAGERKDREHPYHCVILATSDVHGHIMPVDYATGEPKDASLAKLGTLIRAERAESPELLLIDNGDALQGTPLTYYAAAAFGREENTDTERLHPVVLAMNALDYDAAVPGNHEFNYGMGLLRKAVRDSSFPWLSASVVEQASGVPAFGKPYKIKMLNGGRIKAAVLGATTGYIPNWERPEHIEGLQFVGALEAVAYWADYIHREERPDILIVAYHGGFERDLETGEEAERQTGENEGYTICKAAKELGIDALITGHQHRFLATRIYGIPVVQPGNNGMAIGKIVLELVEAENSKWSVSAGEAELLYPLAATQPDERVQEAAGPVHDETGRWIDLPVGKVVGGMAVGDPLACRSRDNSFISFVHRVQLEASGAQLSCAALLSERTAGFGPVVTMRDVLANFMFPNTIMVLKLSGRDIREALEQSARYFRLHLDGKLGIDPAYTEPKAQHYNYDMWSGIEYELDIRMPVGRRVTKLERHGKPVTDDSSYEVVMNNYRAGGGGDYDMFRGKPIMREVAVEMAELVADYFRRHGEVEAECSEEWRVVY